ncbi:helix-turn-helix domain-containing protein [Haladaptatus caseinilyticus]|uniref:helix-turn-helix domain-containing protein n=1 Tax=Haladaptatus caseinilyticus TaxID=2993314 RepID=UPI00224B5EE2|nr:helix-turn-helix domain-containing protein [Haladaptatus caseinilyticus]
MTTIINITVPPTDFPLGSIFETFSEVDIELERVIPTNHALVPYFWVWGKDVDDIEDAFESNPAVHSIELVDTVKDGALFRTEWNLDVDGILKGITKTRLVLLSATGSEDHWEFEFRTQDHEGMTEFQDYCADHDIPITITRIYTVAEMQVGTQYRLTPPQESALVSAFDAGYFDKPREATLEEVSADLEITRQALSERLRRGHRNLIANTLIHPRREE